MTDETTDLQTATGMGTRTLNPRQLRFIAEYVVDLSPGRAAVRAGYSSNGADVQGHRLLKNAKIATAIQKKKQALAKRTEISQEWVIKRLQAVHDASMERSDTGGFANPAAANRSLELIGKHGGMWQDGHLAGDIQIQVNVHPWNKDDD